MKRFNSPESFGAMIYLPQEKKNQNQKHNYTYSTDFQAMLDGIEDEDFTEESSRNGEKKRRLSLDQAKTLEKIFEVDNKLEAEQKVKIAEELGLKPRQVAIWFQNRRARLKTKQLERDYRLLKANYEALKLKFQIAVKEKESFVAEAKELRAKLGEENTESNHSVVAETLPLESEKTFTDHDNYSRSRIYHQPEQTNPGYGIPNDANSFEIKDGLSERNCSGFFNEESDLNSQLPMLPPTPSSFRYESSSSMYSSWVNYFQLLESKAKGYQDQFVKVEEQSALFSTEDFQQYFLT